tara:strand:- start:971 stop:1156 length:186 start_codon:yes stop_codon:yes gene_type:complete
MNNLVAGDLMMARIKKLEAELAELKQVINKLPSRNSANLVSEIYNAIELVKAFAQAKEQSE